MRFGVVRHSGSDDVAQHAGLLPRYGRSVGRTDEKCAGGGTIDDKPGDVRPFTISRTRVPLDLPHVVQPRALDTTVPFASFSFVANFAFRSESALPHYDAKGAVVSGAGGLNDT